MQKMNESKANRIKLGDSETQPARLAGSSERRFFLMGMVFFNNATTTIHEIPDCRHLMFVTD